MSGTCVQELSGLQLLERYLAVRQFSELLAEPLTAEDCAIQSMPDVSPTRWHLAHTTWFFETFVLAKQSGYEVFDPQFAYLFNSYYNTLGKQFPRPQRGLLSRPSLGQIRDYRRHVDEQIDRMFADGHFEAGGPLAKILEVGIHHEQQHQELILTDIKHVFSCNPLHPVYRPGTWSSSEEEEAKLTWLDFDEGLVWIGHEGDHFAYDNETPRHRVFTEEFGLRNRLVTCGEYLQFVEEGGYRKPELWLSEGWRHVSENHWEAPLYWIRRGGKWWEFTLAGLQEIDPQRPVCHVSYFEADAFARSSGARLPTEAEWEVAASGVVSRGRFADELLAGELAVHPCRPPAGQRSLLQLEGDVWEWTSSPYTAYPGYRPPQGALGEYNGKFMCNQYVLRGGSCATPSTHIRRTYRNFFPAEARWQFSGIRLAR